MPPGPFLTHLQRSPTRYFAPVPKGAQDRHYVRLNAAASPNPPPPDADGDGVSDSSDNCPNVANPNQADGDGDGVGDAWDTPPSTGNFNPSFGKGSATKCSRTISSGPIDSS
jgi:hypothetical protein